jgi:two-component system CheB/CheR fusion protein
MAKKPREKKSGTEPAPAAGDPESAGGPGHLPTVAIGCSAGGLQALQVLFEELPNDLGLAYVVIAHLNPDSPSELGPILQRRTEMPVVLVEGLTRLEADKIYVIPPGRELYFTDNSVETREFREPRGHRSPIDHFFRSVGEQHGDGFAIVLSGGGSDGSVGLKAIKEGGGLILVQEPAEAEFGSMPRSAISTGLADIVLPVRELAHRLAELARDKQKVELEGSSSVENTIASILGYMRSRTGHDFARYKRSTIMRRLTRRMQLNRASDLAGYLVFLRENVEEVSSLFSDMLISVTTFFRDPEAFDAVSRLVMPSLVDGAEEPIRIWVPGCATGEEAYSIAILILEACLQRGERREIQIFATDLDPGVLATARDGRYPTAIAADVSEDRLQRFFTREGDHYRIRKEVRDLVVFAPHSLLKDPPFSRLDLISCRNLLIYLERELQHQVFAAFRYALRPGRYLFLGSAETVDGSSGQFRPVDREQRIFQAAEGGAPPQLPKLLLAPHAPVMPVARVPARAALQGEAAIHLRALEQNSPPSLLVDEDERIVHLSESAGRYLQPSGGLPSAAITQIARSELRLDLRTGLHRAFEKGESTLSLPVPVQFNGHAHRVLLFVQPVARPDEHRKLALVMFIDGGAFEPSEIPIETLGEANDRLIRQLQQELQLTRERLKDSREEYESTNEELRAANEELQSINEEYRSTAEELETSKEELQSMNEELQTLNTELKMKLEGVSRANSDLQNLMAATEVGTLFLDTRMRIKRFTPRIAELFNITPTDEGRPITDFTHRLNYEGLAEDALTVLKHLAPLEREAESKTGNWYLMRLRPYRTIEDKIDGVVVTFVDVTERRSSEQRLRLLTAELDHRVKNILARVSVLVDRSEENAKSATDLASTLRRRIQSMADTHALLSRSQWSGASLKKLCAKELEPYVPGASALVSGDDVILSPAAAQAYSMVIHELTTNATKYGALSKTGGRVAVEISTRSAGDGVHVVLLWREMGGPAVTRPARRGFGLSIIEESLAYELSAKVSIDFPATGLVVRIDAPAGMISATP